MQPFRAADVLMMGVLALFWGLGFVFIKTGLDSFSPMAQGAARYDIAGLLLLAVAAFRRKGPLFPTDARAWTAILVAGTLNTFGYTALINWGEKETTAGIAAVIVGLNPVATTVFTRAILPQDRVGWGGFVGLAMGLGGIALLFGLKPGELFDAQGLAELAVVIAISSWALGSVIVRRVGHTMELFAFVGWQILFGGLLFHVAAFALEDGGTWTWDANGFTAILYLALFSSAAGFALYFALLRRVGPIRTNLVSHLAPVVTNVAGLLFLGDPFQLRALLAFGLILGGFVLVARQPPPPVAREPLPPAEGGTAVDAEPAGRGR